MRDLQAITRTVDHIIGRWAREHGPSHSHKHLRKAYEEYRRDLQLIWELVLWRAPAVGMEAEELRAALREHAPSEVIRTVLPLYAAAAGRQQARTRRKNRDAGRRRGRDLRDNTHALDADIRRVSKTYRATYPHSRDYSTRKLAAYLARKLSRPVGTIRNRLKALAIR